MKRGITLIEVLVVLTVITMASLTYTFYIGDDFTDAVSSSDVSMLKKHFTTIADGFDGYMNSHMTYPDASTYQETLVSGNYMKSLVEPSETLDYGLGRLCYYDKPNAFNGIEFKKGNITGPTDADDYYLFVSCVNDAACRLYNEKFTSLTAGDPIPSSTAELFAVGGHGCALVEWESDYHKRLGIYYLIETR